MRFGHSLNLVYFFDYSHFIYNLFLLPLNLSNSNMCEHSELVAEMLILEKMSIQERLKLARKRRIQQLKKWSQREKDLNYKRKKVEVSNRVKFKKIDYKVHFVPSVMLLEAAARNDIKEGECFSFAFFANYIIVSLKHLSSSLL